MIDQRREDSFPDSDIYASVWLVRCGNKMVGPVSLELIARGLDAGRIPADAEMTHLDHPVWRPVTAFGPMPDPFGDPCLPAASDSMRMSIPDTIPEAAPSFGYPEEPISTPMLGLFGSVFG